ncbi:MAG: amidohydrolase [Armatimonadetes bacterium]|nr:amidohydrolase [Armatimonadota bacterium]
MKSLLAEKLLQGELIDDLIIDAHAHLGPWHNFFVRRGGWADAMVESMDACGIDVAIVAPHVAIGPDERRGNEQAYEAAARHPRRIVPYVVVNPNRGADGVEAEILHWESAGIRAFKLHPAVHQYPAAGANYRPVYEYANEHSLPILSHCWDGDPHGAPSVVAGLAAEYPNASFIIGHAASSWSIIQTACEEVARRANVYLDLTGSPLWYGGLEYLVANADPARILFGSDNPFIDPRPPLGRVLFARISDEHKRMILGLNAKRLFRL